MNKEKDQMVTTETLINDLKDKNRNNKKKR